MTETFTENAEFDQLVDTAVAGLIGGHGSLAFWSAVVANAYGQPFTSCDSYLCRKVRGVDHAFDPASVRIEPTDPVYGGAPHYIESTKCSICGFHAYHLRHHLGRRHEVIWRYTQAGEPQCTVCGCIVSDELYRLIVEHTEQPAVHRF